MKEERARSIETSNDTSISLQLSKFKVEGLDGMTIEKGKEVCIIAKDEETEAEVIVTLNEEQAKAFYMAAYRMWARLRVCNGHPFVKKTITFKKD